MSTTTTAETRISPETARTIGRVTNAAVLVLALAAAALSYHGLYRLAVIEGVPTMLAPLLPVVIDGLVLTGSLSTVYAALAGLSGRWSWLLVLTGVTASVLGNASASEGHSLVAHVVAAAPPVVLALSLETALRLARHRATLGPASTRRRVRTAPPAVVADVPPVKPAAEPATPKPTTRPTPPTRGGTREQVAALLAANPNRSAGDIARELGRDPSSVRKYVRELRDAPVAPAHLVAAVA